MKVMDKYLEILYYIKVELEEEKVRKKKNLNLVLFYFIFIDNKYRVTVYTGKKIGAGTDADVFITLYGKEGESGPTILKDKKNNFEAGRCELKYILRYFYFLLYF
jgi:hypothetical protein